jgi:hypothetical protein
LVFLCAFAPLRDNFDSSLRASASFEVPLAELEVPDEV